MRFFDIGILMLSIVGFFIVMVNIYYKEKLKYETAMIDKSIQGQLKLKYSKPSDVVYDK